MVNTTKAIQSLWKGQCSIFDKGKRINPESKQTEFFEKPLYLNQPCRLSYKAIPSTIESDHAAKVLQTVKLFIAPNLNIPAGSKIVITQNGVTKEYSHSGNAAIYTNHQEIELEAFRKWA